MSKRIRILFLSANPWTTSRILVDEEAREIFDKLQEGSYRDQFLLYQHTAIRPGDIQRLLMTYRPQIVHFSGHGSKKNRIILGGVPGRGKQINRQALVEVFALYRHVRLVFLNACCTEAQGHSLSEVIDYCIGASRPIGDREGVTFAGAFYRALGFGKSVKEAFDSATAEVALRNLPRARGIGLFVRDGVSEGDRFPDWTPGLEHQSLASVRIDPQLSLAHVDVSDANDALIPARIAAPSHIKVLQRLGSWILDDTGEAVPHEELAFSYEQIMRATIGLSRMPPQASMTSVSAASNWISKALTVEHRSITLSQSPPAQSRTRSAAGTRRSLAKNRKRRNTQSARKRRKTSA